MSNKEIVKEWIKFSKNDLDCAEYLNNMKPKPLEIMCYHCQQSAEKVLKAFLIFSEIIPPKIHELNRLCEMCEDIDVDFEKIAIQCGSLTKYGIQPRYPYELDITDEETQSAVRKAKTILDFVTGKLECK